MVNKNRNPGLVGQYIRERREALRLSQRNLGQLFSPPVTTQFISNVERGVTPLPPNHVPTLSQALQIAESDLLQVMEREYTLKLSGRLTRPVDGADPTGQPMVGGPPVHLNSAHPGGAWLRNLAEAFQKADPATQRAFAAACQNLLKVGIPEK